MKTSGNGCDGDGVPTAPPKVLICWKSEQNSGINGAQRCLTSRNGTQGLHKNTLRPVLEITPKKALNDLHGRKFVGHHASILPRPCAYYSTLSLLIAAGYNVSLEWTKIISGLPRQSSS